MSDEQGQEPEPQTAQVAESAPSAPPSTTPESKVETFDAEYVGKLRREAADYRKRATAAEAAVQAAKDAELSEVEKLQKRAEDAEKRAQEHEAALNAERLRGAVTRVATKLGFADVEDAGRFLDETAIARDDAGNPTNIEQLLSDILKAKPYLRGSSAGATTNAATRGATAEKPMTVAERRQAIYGSGGGAWDSARIREAGGGVIMPKEHS